MVMIGGVTSPIWRVLIMAVRADDEKGKEATIGAPGIATNGARTLRTGLLALLLVTSN